MSKQQNRLFNFLEKNKSFSYTTLENFLIDNNFPEFIEEQIPLINKGIVSHYSALLFDADTAYKKQFIQSKIFLFIEKLNNHNLKIWSYNSIMPSDYFPMLELLSGSLVLGVRELVRKAENNFLNSSEHIEKSSTFSLNEVACFIHLLRKENLFRNNIQSNELAKAFHFLTGYSEDSLNNFLTKPSFERNKGIVLAKKTVKQKLHKIESSL